MKEYLKELDEQIKSLKEEFLIENNLYKIVTSPTKKEGYHYDYEKEEYCKYEILDLSDKELEEIFVKYNNLIRLKRKSGFITFFRRMAVIMFILGLIIGVYVGIETVSFLSFLNGIWSYGVCGLLFLGIAEIINCLEDIRRK